jgi:hypothetical protein
MAHNHRRGSAGNGAQGIAVVSATASIAQAAGVTVRRGPGGYAEWSIEGICTDVPMSDQKLRSYRRFCNVIKHWSGVSLDPQSAWSAIVEAAIAKCGASS